MACRFLPTTTPSSMLSWGVMTKTFNELPCAGVLNPAGVASDSGAVPGVAGSNCVTAALTPPVKVTGEVVMVPTAGFKLLIFTFTVNPPRTACGAWKFPDGSSNEAITVRSELGAPVVVRKSAPIPNGPLNTNPDGCRVTVLSELPSPEALAV